MAGPNVINSFFVCNKLLRSTHFKHFFSRLVMIWLQPISTVVELSTCNHKIEGSNDGGGHWHNDNQHNDIKDNDTQHNHEYNRTLT
jgi:hypothetical protein